MGRENLDDKKLPTGEPVAAKDAEELADKTRERQKRKRRRKRALRSLLLRTVLLVLVVYILLFHIVGLAVMPRDDMSPRLGAGDMLLFYRLDRTPKSRDVIVIEKAVDGNYAAVDYTPDADPGIWRKALRWLGFKDPEAPPARWFVCRVVACPGDTVEITEERGLTVNGNSLVETNIYAPTLPYEGYVDYPVKLGAGEFFVLADSRNGGVDSRNFGVVKQDEILGIVITILRRNNL